MAVNKFWLDDVDKEKKEKYIQVLKSSPELKKLQEELKSLKESLRSERSSKGLYDTANWPYVQADYAGQDRLLTKLISWTTFD